MKSSFYGRKSAETADNLNSIEGTGLELNVSLQSSNN